MSKFSNTLRLLSGVSILAVCQPAIAQDSPGSTSEAIGEDDDARIIVTGSRIVRDGSDSPVPVTVIAVDDLVQSNPSSTIIQSLSELPAFAATGPTNRPGNGGNNGSARVLALRNLGNQRTLVLFDGRRVPPTSVTGQVNADFVPSMLLERVDVVTGGASAVYGSDAVAGVVNFVTDTDFTGLKVDGRFGISQLGDAENYQVGIAGGADIMGGRGHIMGSYEYYKAPGVFNKLTREFGRNNYSIQGAGTEANPYAVVANTLLNETSFLGNIVSVGNPLNNNGSVNNLYNNLGDVVFLQNSSAGANPEIVQPFRFGIPTGRATVDSGGDGGYFYNASLQGAQRSHLLYGRFDYELTDSVNFFALGTFNDTFNKNFHESVEFRLQTFSSNNAFLPVAIQDQLTTGPDARSTVRASKIITQVPAKSPTTDIQTYMTVVGFDGALGNFDWQVAYQRARNEQYTQLINNTDNRRAAAALDAVDEGFETSGVRNGNVVCRVTITNPTLFPGCLPLNIFGPTSESSAALDYVLATTAFTAKTGLDTFNAEIAGPVFELPAGDFQVALSGEYRKLTFENDSNAEPVSADCTGLRYNCGPNTLMFQSNVRGSLPQVSQTVKEAAIEVDVPILRDTFIDDLGFSGAVRYTDYSNSGTVFTWKAGLELGITDGLRVRATRSRDIRAPNLVELFAPRVVNPAGNTDLLTGIVGQIPNITDSNADLEPEVASTFTAGVVFEPSFIPGLSLAVDYYDISIKGAITNLGGNNNTVQQICVASAGADPLCDLIQRPLPWSNTSAANFATAFFIRPVNANVQSTWGIDFELAYSFDLGPGTLSFRSLAAYQPELNTTQTALGLNDPENVMGADENPKLKVTSFLGYRAGPFSVDLRHRWWSSEYYNPGQIESNTPSIAPLVFVNLEGKDRVPSYQTFNLTLGYDVTDDMNVYFGVTNLLDKQPTPIGRIGGPAGVPGLFGGFRNGEDTIGRFFSLGFRFRR